MTTEDTTQGAEIVDDGQPEVIPDAPANDTGAESSDDGQPEGGASATDTGHDGVEPIFDPQEFSRLTADLPPELKGQVDALHKSLQGAFTKKTQSLADQRKKIEAYDAFTKDPRTAMERFAKQFGYELKVPGAPDQPSDDRWTPEAGDPKNWKDVIDYIREDVRKEFSGEMGPIVQEFQTMRKQTIETQLSDIDPGWQQYEDAMMDTLKKHPTMATDPANLYRMSVPAEVLESRATQRAIAKMEAKTKSSHVAGPSSTNKKPAVGMPSGKVSFSDAVTAAKAKLAEEGLSPGQ